MTFTFSNIKNQKLETTNPLLFYTIYFTANLQKKKNIY